MMKPEPPRRSADDTTLLLVTRLREKHPDAAATLHRLYRDALLRFCWGYLGGVDEAEDATQEISYKVVSAANVPDAFRPWLYRIARNHCLNRLRDRGRNPVNHHLPAPSQLDAALTGQLTRLARDEAKSRVAAMVLELDESYREVLRLRYVEDLPRGEIAEVLDIPESVVKSRLFEGLQKLRGLASRLTSD
jgi:RNA polymerase sigma-70 factor (ECF subfamily)